MIEAVNNVKNVVGDAAAFRTAAPQKAPVEDQAPAATKNDVAPLSPRLRPDFLSGTIVTEFVGNNGQVTQQSPTVAALAYLRAGLDATGQHKTDPSQADAGTAAPVPNAIIA